MKPIRTIQDLTPDPKNANRGTKRGRDLLERSLERGGAGRSILVDKNGVIIAGNKTFEEAGALGFDIQLVKTDGRRLLVHQREDLDMTDPGESGVRAREMAIADNRIAQLDLDWDPENLLNAEGVELSLYFFDDELKAIRDDHRYEGEIADTAKTTERKHAVTSHECPKCAYKW